MSPLPAPHRLQQLLASPEAQALSTSARARLQHITDYATGAKTVSETCDTLGIARSTFHRWLEKFDANDLSTLEDKPHDPVNVRTSAIAPETVTLIRTYRERDPLAGKETISARLQSEHNVTISPASVGRVIERECLYFGHTPLHWRKRMQHQAAAHAGKNVTSEVTIEANDKDACADGTCSCRWCAFRSKHGRAVKRTLVTGSVLVNLALIGAYLATAYWENEGGLEANLTHREEISTFATYDGE